MIHSGLVSITFRKLSPREIVDLVVQAGLAGVEWGGDVHVPHGDLRQARLVRRLTREAGLRIAAYGSYYRVGADGTGPFEPILDTAVELGAPLIRVWAGDRASADADAPFRARVVRETQQAADLAAGAGIAIAYEFHPRTLTDTDESARRLLEDVAHENVGSYWQPPPGASMADNLAGLDAVLPWLRNVHVFTWHRTTGERVPLADGEAGWMRVLRKVASTGRDHFALVEFVRDDAEESFLHDAATLRRWLSLLDRRQI
ncbi:MAG TPA: TIM barrel protein [Anaerolineae bacterium]|nr:TIM barrel protein [Anaerolineae bacterium]